MVRDFNAELRREEALQRAEGMPDRVQRSIWLRVRASIEQHQAEPRRARLPGLALALAAAAVVAVLTIFALRAPSQLGEFQVALGSDDLEAHVRGGVVEIERGATTLVDPTTGATLETVGPVALRREPSGVRVVRGRTNISVPRRAAGAVPVNILVSHGVIEVMGTAFSVVQGPSEGSVLLREGRIQFRGEGRALTLRPGERLSWPLRASLPPASSASSLPEPSLSPAPGVKPSPSAEFSPRPFAEPLPSGRTPTIALPSTSPPSSPSVPNGAASASPAEALLDRVEALRGRHQFEAAARELERGIPAQPRAVRERLSFELGSLFTHQIHDKRRACAHWAAHERNFRGGRYREEVARSQRALGCGGEPNTP
jgi:transmembrane sensor